MSTDTSTLWLRTPLDRRGPLPLHEQLRSSIEIAIIAGDLEDGAPLPSVRRLSSELGIAPSTVVRVYQDLLDAQLIKAVPRHGYFVTTGPALDSEAPTTLAVRRLIDDAIEGAISLGFELPTVLQLVAEQVRRRQQGLRRVAVVGHRDAALADRVTSVKQALDGLPVEVIGLSFQELRGENGHGLPADLAGITWFLVPVGETREAAALLGSHARRIVTMTRALRPDVQDFIARQPDSTRFGIIAGADVFAGRLLTMIRRVHPFLMPPIITSMDHPDDVARVIDMADALIVGGYAYPELQGRLPAGKPSAELAYLPDERTLRRLRNLVATDIAGG
jgi:DNA-binding transcriptional regulator YhcF (GntR family)